MPIRATGSPDDAARFVEKWSGVELSERAASHEHFIDLCHLLGQPTPASADATGDDYTFEKHVKVVRSASKGSKGEHGFVDVWKRGHFAWEYKQKASTRIWRRRTAKSINTGMTSTIRRPASSATSARSRSGPLRLRK